MSIRGLLDISRKVSKQVEDTRAPKFGIDAGFSQLLDPLRFQEGGGINPEAFKYSTGTVNYLTDATGFGFTGYGKDAKFGDLPSAKSITNINTRIAGLDDSFRSESRNFDPRSLTLLRNAKSKNVLLEAGRQRAAGLGISLEDKDDLQVARHGILHLAGPNLESDLDLRGLTDKIFPGQSAGQNRELLREVYSFLQTSGVRDLAVEQRQKSEALAAAGTRSIRSARERFATFQKTEDTRYRPRTRRRTAGGLLSEGDTFGIDKTKSLLG